jgi:uncharacterized protein YbjT (DUF2867 family)
MKILVTGATGYIGSRLVPELLAQGHAVRCLARDAAKLGARGWQGTEVVAGDVLAPETLPAALAGIEVAYYLVHSMNSDGADFAQRDRAAARNFAEAAAAQGVSRIVYLGGLGDGAALSEHLTSRQETGDVLRRSGVPVTELRAAIIVGSGSASFEIIRDLARKLPFMICPRWVSSRCEPIAVRDVLAYLTGVLAEPRTVGRTFEIGGGETYTYADLMRICADVMGRRVRILTVPFLTPRLSAYWLNLVTAVPMSIARPLVEGLRNDVVTRDRSIRDLIRLDLVKFREAVALSLAREGRAGLPSRWTGASTAASARPWPERAPLLSDTRTVVSPSGAAEVFARVRRLGGTTGWYYANGLWELRGALDRIAGGVGLRRGRPDGETLRVGDPVDFWRVERYEEGRLLELRAEMKLPGQARLTFETAPRAGGGSVLTQRADFHPSGFWGRLYWYALIPVHAIIFRGMAERIAAPGPAIPSSPLAGERRV